MILRPFLAMLALALSGSNKPERLNLHDKAGLVTDLMCAGDIAHVCEALTTVASNGIEFALGCVAGDHHVSWDASQLCS